MKLLLFTFALLASYCLAAPLKCSQELEGILSQPNQVALDYFAPYEATIRRQSPLWFNPATQYQVANTFTQETGISAVIQFAIFARNLYPDIMRSWSLAQSATVKEVDETFYSFTMFDSFGQMLTISLYQANTNMPLKQICYQ